MRLSVKVTVGYVTPTVAMLSVTWKTESIWREIK